MDDIRYLRITPYNPKTGALAKKVCVGSMIFEEGRWYRVRTVVAQRIAPLLQESGVPYFQVCTDAEWNEIARRETIAAARMHGIPIDGPMPSPQVSAPPKRGPQASMFDDLRGEAVTEIAGAESLATHSAPVGGGQPDVSGGEAVASDVDAHEGAADGAPSAAVPQPAGGRAAKRVVVGSRATR